MQRAKAEGAPSFSWGAASLGMVGSGSEVEELLDLADASLYAARRRARRPAPVRSNRRRVAMVGAAAAAAIAGIGSSVFVLQPSSDETAIGASAPHQAHSQRARPGSGTSKQTRVRTSAPVPGRTPSRSSGTSTQTDQRSRTSRPPSGPPQTIRITGEIALPILTVSTTKIPVAIAHEPSLVPVVARKIKPILRTSPVPRVPGKSRWLEEPRLQDPESARWQRKPETCIEHSGQGRTFVRIPWFHFPWQRDLAGLNRHEHHSSVPSSER
jgi:hypothetical protein